jgi:leader peptidase (prepilin peptidase)/N-methyltransferase
MAAMLQPDWMLPVLAAPFVGSFLGLVIVRLPAGGNVVFGRSACLACDHTLGPTDLVPLLSWLARRGRCRHCGARVSALYPGVELAALGVSLWAATVVGGWLLWASCVLGWSLLALAVIDWRHKLLPDGLTLPLIVLGLGTAYLANPTNIVAHLAGAAAGYVAFAAIAWAYRRLRGREGLGLGDAKLLAAAGAWTSWTGLASVVLIGAVAALGLALLGRARGNELGATTELAFGPHLTLGTWLVWLYGPIMVGG